MPVDYSRGKVYRIICAITKDQYIGSTTLHYLSRRLQGHLAQYKAYMKGTMTSRLTSYPILERGNYSISLLETYPCNSKAELEARERFYIETMPCVNKIVPTRTKKENYEANKTEINERRKVQYQVNRPNILIKNKERYDKNRDALCQEKKVYRDANREVIAVRQKAYYEANKERLQAAMKAKRAARIMCGCGSDVEEYRKARHEKTAKHINYLKFLETQAPPSTPVIATE